MLEFYAIHTGDRAFCLVSEAHQLCLVIRAAANAAVSISLDRPSNLELARTAKRLSRVFGCLGLLHAGNGPLRCTLETITSALMRST